MKYWELEIIESIVNRVTRLEIRQKTRVLDYVKARMIYYKIAVKITKISITSIGKFIDFDHATVLYNLKNFDRDIMLDERYNAMYQKCLLDASRIVSDYDIDHNELKTVQALLKENQELKIKLASNLKQMSRNDKMEEKLLNIFYQMDLNVKLDLIQKAETILKVKQKLNENTTNVRRV